MTTSYKLWCVVLLGLLVLSCGERPAPSSVSQSSERLALPDALIEVSGLTSAPDGTLYALGDENGQVYRIAFERKAISKAVSFGQPPVRADFEGLTLTGDELYGITSSGMIYQVELSRGSTTKRINTGLAKRCEFEGIAADPLEPVLWLLCKTPLKKSLKKRLNLFAWHLDENRLREDLMISEKYKSLGLSNKWAPSGLAVSQDGQTFTIVAAKQQAYLRLSRAGELLAANRFPAPANHPQAEGVALVNQSIFVADEGHRSPGVISRYADGF